MSALARGALLLTTLLLPSAAFSEAQKPAEILARFHRTVAEEYRYRETRTLELMTAPWQGKGYLYSAPDGTLIKLQLAPERAIMAISGERMIHYDDARDRRQSAPLAAAGSMAEQIRSFRAILQGRADELEAAYDLRAETTGKAWTLRLTGKPRPEGEPAPTIEMSGEGGKRRIVIERGDGEKTEYVLEKAREGQVLEGPMRGLLVEALGE